MTDNSELIANTQTMIDHDMRFSRTDVALVLNALIAAEQTIAERTKQRDELFDLADKHITERDALTEQLAAAQAVIALIAKRAELHGGYNWLDPILAQSPTDALEAVKHEAWDEGANAVALSFLAPLGENGMRPKLTNPYRAETEGENP